MHSNLSIQFNKCVKFEFSCSEWQTKFSCYGKHQWFVDMDDSRPEMFCPEQSAPPGVAPPSLSRCFGYPDVPVTPTGTADNSVPEPPTHLALFSHTEVLMLMNLFSSLLQTEYIKTHSLCLELVQYLSTQTRVNIMAASWKKCQYEVFP